MTTSSTTANQKRLRRVASPFVTYSCPDWCVRGDHHADRIDADNPPHHYGPKFGLIETGAAGDGAIKATIFEKDVETLDAASLRKLAADALAAADWLEAAGRRRSFTGRAQDRARRA